MMARRCSTSPSFSGETVPDIVPIWTITYPIGRVDETAFTTDETAKLVLQVMRRAPMRK